MTGVLSIPTLPTMLPWLVPTMSLTGTGTAEGLVRSTFHNGVGDVLSASNAYTLSFIVTMYSTLRGTPLMETAERYNGCAYTAPSTGYEYSFPKSFALTFDGVSVVSFRFAPDRRPSYLLVATSTCARSEAGTRSVATRQIGTANRENGVMGPSLE